MIAEDFIGAGHPVSLVLRVLGLSRSSYYYQPKAGSGKKGRAKSEYTLNEWTGELVSNDQVLEQIDQLLLQEFVDYGYLKVTHWLRSEKGYVINPKKVYRLMREKGLLNQVVKRKKEKRNWVKQLVPQPDYIFEYLEVDIKYIYVSGLNKSVLLLSVIDVASRWVLGQYLGWSIKNEHLRALFDQLFGCYPLPGHFYVRNDNGSQFEASLVQDYFKDKGVVQEFCHPATPEQNAHIESYHSIIERVVCRRYEFDDLPEAQGTMNRFLKFYNFERIHSGIGYTSPFKYLLRKGIDMKEYDIQQSLDCSCTLPPEQIRTLDKTPIMID